MMRNLDFILRALGRHWRESRIEIENKVDHCHHKVENGWKEQGWRKGLGSHLGERGMCPELEEGP